MRHLRAASALEGIRVWAMPVRSERRADLLGAGFRTIDSLDRVDAVGPKVCVVATETGRHSADSVGALRNGFHVLVEKPLAVDAAQAREVLEQADALKLRVFVACVLRFSE